MAGVAALLAMDRTTLTANLKPLERRGLVTTMVSEKDRRSRLLSLTADGRAALAGAVPIWTALHGEIESGLSDAGRLRAELARLSAVTRV